MAKPYLILYVATKNKAFKKEFETEFKRDQFERKLRYSAKLSVVEKGGGIENDKK